MSLRNALSFRSGILATVLIVTCLAMAGCATQVPMPDQPFILSGPRTLHVVQQRADAPDRDAVLVVRADGPRTYWTLIDLLGIPLARQVLHEGEWRNDGFLPPNREARALFAGLVFAWTPPSALASHYGIHNIQLDHQMRSLSVDGNRILTVTQTHDDWELKFTNGVRWLIAPLKESQ